MAWDEKQLKRNTFGEIVPQYFDEVLGDWVPYTGVYGEVTLSGNIHEDVIATNLTVLAGTTQYYYASIPPAARYWGVWLRAIQIDGKLDVIARPKYKDVGQYADPANSEVMIKGKTGATYNYPVTAMGSLQVPGVLFMLQETSGSADAQLTEFTLWAVM